MPLFDSQQPVPTHFANLLLSPVAAIAARIASTMTGGIAKSPVVKEEKEKKDVYDGAFTHDIDINDLRNRYLITKGSTQQQVSRFHQSIDFTTQKWVVM